MAYLNDKELILKNPKSNCELCFVFEDLVFSLHYIWVQIEWNNETGGRNLLIW